MRVPRRTRGSSGALASSHHPVPGWLHGGRRCCQVQAGSLSAVLLKPFMGKRLTVMGVMLIRDYYEHVHRNTATTATMFAVMMPVIMACRRARRAPVSPCRSPWPRTSAAWARRLARPERDRPGRAGERESGNLPAVDAWPCRSVLEPAGPVVGVHRVALHPLRCKFDIDTSARFEVRNAVIFYSVAGLTILLWMTGRCTTFRPMSSATTGRRHS